ncbi:MAG: hypothetical protein JXA71_18565 [Chitinispirillaceae bacterium]|nr:hypothetical protein [Chitinispirillaceae bacterium]
MEITRKTVRLIAIFVVVFGAHYSLPAQTAAISPDSIQVSGLMVAVPGTPRPGDLATISLSFRNKKKTPLTLDANGFFIGCRRTGANRDFGHQFRNQIIQPDVPISFSAEITLDSAGVWEFWPAYHIGGHYGPYKWQVKTLTVTAVSIPSTASANTAPASTPASSQMVTSPPQTSPHYALLEGLKLIKENKFDDWISFWCSAQDLCFNATSISSLKKYDLPALARLAPDFLKNNGTAIHVSRIEGNPQTDVLVKIFLLGKAGSMPKPFTMIKRNNSWKFYRL